MIGAKGKEGAFVFGFYSFLDKCLVGLTVYVVTHSEAYSNTEQLTGEQLQYMRFTATAIPAAACILGTLGVLFYPIPEYSK